MSEYDPQLDAFLSYYAAIEAKRKRGDTDWISPKREEARLRPDGGIMVKGKDNGTRT